MTPLGPAFLLAFAAFGAPISRVRAQELVCRAPDEVAQRTLVELRELVTSTDTRKSGYRDSVRIPATTPEQVHLVADEALCREALVAFNKLWQTPGRLRKVAVYKVGERFLVEDPDHGQDSEYRGLQVFDMLWRYQATMLTF
jgi:hypothetical protein